MGTEFNMDTEMKVKINKEFFLSLEANPTTGYRWEAIFDKNFLELKSEIYKPYSSEIIGGGGIDKFIFIPTRTGETTITMRYKRAWESNAYEEKAIKIIIA